MSASEDNAWLPLPHKCGSSSEKKANQSGLVKKHTKTNCFLSQPCYEGLPFKTLKLAQNADVTRCHQLVITSPCLWLPLAVLVADLKLLISLQPQWGAPRPIQTSFTSIFSLVLKKEGTHCGERGMVGGGGDKNTNPVSLTMDACVLCFSRHWMSLLVHVLRILK